MDSTNTTPAHRFTMDGHNDALYYAGHNGGTARFDQGWSGAQLSLPGLRKGGIDATFFAIFGAEEETKEHRHELAAAEVDNIMAGYHAWLDTNPNYRLMYTAADLAAVAAAAEAGGAETLPFGVLLHLEGARGIRDIEHLHQLHELGLRSLGLTWNMPNVYATGAGGDPATGLTARGRELVRELEALNMVIDASHLNRQGLWDLLEIATRPIIVTHTGCRALFDHPRNLQDDQLSAVADTGGTIGIFPVNMFLGPKGTKITMQTMVDHYQHLIDIVGPEHVALGTDLGGISSGTPTGLDAVDDLPNLLSALSAAGWDEATITGLRGGNYLRVVSELLG